MIRLLFNLVLILIIIPIWSQSSQLQLSRVDQMPDSPLPLQIRDWKTVAQDYDSYVFDLSKIGQYLPLSRLGALGEFNYADNIPLYMDSYVGAIDHLNQAEAINIMRPLSEHRLWVLIKAARMG